MDDVGSPWARLDDPARLADLAATGLADSASEEAFDRFTRLVVRALGVPVSTVSLVDDRRQSFKSVLGGDPDRHETPLSHSLCRHAVTADAPFVVEDARTDPRTARSGAVLDDGIGAYAGVPVHGPAGLPIGALCAIDREPRRWTDSDLALLGDLAASASELIALRSAVDRHRAVAAEVSHQLRTGLTVLHLEADGGRGPAGPLPGRADALQRALEAASTGPAGPTETVELGELVGRVLDRARPRWTAAGRELVQLPAPVVDVALPPGELSGVLDDLVGVLLEHGSGRSQVQVVDGAGVVRVRLQDDGPGLPAPVSAALSARHDHAGGPSTPPSPAERAARSLGGRLVQRPGRPTLLELVLPRP